MTDFPLIKNLLNLAVYDHTTRLVVDACDLEKALQAAPVAYGKGTQDWNFLLGKDDTHTARVVCIQPIKKKTKAEAALEFVNKLADPVPGLRFFDLLNEAKNISEMKD
jgi:hypothetical protein